MKLNILKCQSVKNSDVGLIEKVYVFADNWTGREGKTVGVPFNCSSVKQARKLANIEYEHLEAKKIKL